MENGRIHIAFANATRDHLRVLGAKIDDGDCLCHAELWEERLRRSNTEEMATGKTASSPIERADLPVDGNSNALLIVAQASSLQRIQPGMAALRSEPPSIGSCAPDQQGGFILGPAQSEIRSLTPLATREALINVGRDRLIPPFKRRGGVRRPRPTGGNRMFRPRMIPSCAQLCWPAERPTDAGKRICALREVNAHGRLAHMPVARHGRDQPSPKRYGRQAARATLLVAERAPDATGNRQMPPFHVTSRKRVDNAAVMMRVAPFRSGFLAQW